MLATAWTCALGLQAYGVKPLDLNTIRALIRGDLQATFALFADRFISGTNVTAVPQAESMRNLLIENELRVILDKRVMAMPKAWEFKADESLGATEELAKEANKWAAGPVADQGMSLFAITGSIDKDQEHDGNAALVFSHTAEGSRVRLRDTAQMGIELDPLTQVPTAARFSWKLEVPAGGNSQRTTIEYEQEITKAGSFLKVNGQAQVDRSEASLGFFPVAIIPRCLERGKPVGVSGAIELIEAYLAQLWSAYLLNVANKYEAAGIYTPTTGSDPSVFFDANGKLITSFQVSPGCFYPYPLQKVGGGINIASIAAQYDRAEATLYRLGKVKRDRAETADMRSGKAMLIDTQELRDYVADKLALRRAGLEQIANFWAWANGKVPLGKPSGLVIECEAEDSEDAQENTRRAELWLKAEQTGKATTQQRLRAWQRLKLIDEDAEILVMAREVEDSENSAMARMMEQRAALQPEDPPEEPEPDDEPPGPDMPHEGMPNG